MKKILTILGMLFCLSGVAQFPNNPSQANTSTNNQFLGALTAQKGLKAGTFSDTSAANSATYISTVPFIMISTTSDNAIWFRNASATAWIQLLPSGGSGGQRAWLIGGQGGIFTSPVSPQYIGVTTNQGFGILTNNIARLTINENGAFGLGAGLSYGNSGEVLTSAGSGAPPTWGSGASSAWALLGNAGTTAGTNFIGTTDDVDFMFKRNSIVSGRISGTNTSLGLSSSVSISSGENNTSFGSSALNSTSTGSRNTAIGFSALRDNVGGSGNIALGSFAGYTPTAFSDRVFINSIDRSGTLGGDTTQSIYYGVQDANAANQRIYHNGRNFTPYATNNTSSNRVMGFISGTGENTFLTLGAGVSINSGVLNATGSQNWQDVLIVGSTLTQDNTIDGGGSNFTMENLNNFYIIDAQSDQRFGMDNLGANKETNVISGVVASRSSIIKLNTDSLFINPSLGNLHIDTLNNETSQNQLIGWTSTTGGNRGQVGYITMGTGVTIDAGVLNVAGASSITASQSVLKTANNLTLVNDSTSFSNDVKIYGYSDGVRGWKDGVITNLTNVQDGDMLVWNSDSSYFENVVDNSRYRLLQFYVDQTNAPADGDSVFYQSTFSGKWVEVYRGGENQTYDDPLNGYEFDSGAATITFHPPLNANEKVKIYIYKEWPTIDTLETPAPSWVDLDYPTQTGLTESPAHVWTGNPANAWNNFGLSGTNLPADGGYAVQYVATDGIMNIAGFNLSNTSEAYANYECGLFLSTGGTVLGMELGTPTGTLATLSVGDWARMHRVGSTIKIQTSTDKISWSDVHTFTFSSSATLYLNLAVYNDGGTSGKCYNPQILIE